MKKILVAVVGVMMLCAIPLMASATSFTFTQAQMLAMTESYDNPPGIGTLISNTAVTVGPLAGGVAFVGNIADGNPQWRSIGIGFPWASPSLPGDLSAYTDYKLTFYNNNNQTWWVNLYMNTGWTDSPYNQPNNFYQNGWTELAVGQSATLDIDFATAGVLNLNHVTNIGFQLAFNESRPTINQDGFQGDDFHMVVTPAVPEPATLLLLGLGLVGVAGIRRKFKK